MASHQASTSHPTSGGARSYTTTAHENARTTALLVGGVVGGLALAFVAGALREDYSALHAPVSLSSLGPWGWVQVANLMVSGILMAACAAGLRRALRPGRGTTWARS